MHLNALNENLRRYVETFLAIAENIANSSPHSLYSHSFWSWLSQSKSLIISIQYWVSLASLSQMEILFRKSDLLRERFASR